MIDVIKRKIVELGYTPDTVTVSATAFSKLVVGNHNELAGVDIRQSPNVKNRDVIIGCHTTKRKWWEL